MQKVYEDVQSVGGMVGLNKGGHKGMKRATKINKR